MCTQSIILTNLLFLLEKQATLSSLTAQNTSFLAYVLGREIFHKWTVSADFWTICKKICRICPFTENFLTRKLAEKSCILHGDYTFWKMRIWQYLQKKFLMDNFIFLCSIIKMSKFLMKNGTARKIRIFFGKCDQIRRKFRIWSHLLKKSLMENFIFLQCEFEPWSFETSC